MSLSQTKKASTPIPLSPEEKYEASQYVGRSLFSALQLAREHQRKKQMMMHGLDPQGGDDKVLKIPIPRDLMPKKAEYGDEPYQVPKDPFEPVENPGTMAHIQRNLGKYLGGYGGAIIGAGLGARGTLKKNPAASLLSTLRGAGKKGLVGGLSGLAAGSAFDDSTKEDYRQKAMLSPQHRRQMLQNMLASGDMMQDDFYKQGNEADEPDPGIFGRAFKSQQNPIRLLVGAQSGFRDAKKDYYMKQRARINDELAIAQREYVDLLGKIKTGSTEDQPTPYVDAFCNGMAHVTLFGKEASHEDVDIADGSMARLMGDVMSTAKKPFQPVIDTAASGLLGTGTGAAYLTYLLRKTMREEPEKYMQEGLPTRVELEPYT